MEPRATLAAEAGIAILRIDNPPLNVLSPALIADMTAAFDRFEADPKPRALVIECAGRSFIAGGDITCFSDPGFSPVPLNRLLARIEASSRPVVVALHGTALGGGLEVAMAAHHRIAAPSTRLGLPEIALGIIPGSLGTQRLPRLAGLERAAQMISSGKPIAAQEALAAGIVDAVAEDPARAARAAARLLAESRVPLRRTGDLPVRDLDSLPRVRAGLEATAAARPWEPALAAIGPVLAAAGLPLEQGAQVEAEAFARLVATPQSRALVHLFLAERAAARIPGLEAGTPVRPVEHLGILGVGTMGAGIGMAFANAGFAVTLVERDEAALARGLAIIDKTYQASVARGRLSAAEAEARRARFTATTEFAALAQADMVIEAVFEDMDLKLDVAARLGAICRPGAIIASNTSTLDVDRIAAATGRPQDVLGTHFFSPAQVMRLLEIVRGDRTAPDVLATVLGLARRAGKVPVVTGVCYGFIGNRMAEVYMRESEAMQLEGASPALIDGTIEDPRWLGMAMGPSRMLDMAGVDVGARTVIEWIRSGQGPKDPAYRILCRTMFDEGRHGQKTGQGYYRYEGRERLPAPEQAALAARLAADHGIGRRDDIAPEEIFERLFFPMVSEAALILSEGIAYRPGDIDVVWTAGYGFPAWRGGPLFMADEIGLARIVERMDHYAATRGNAHGAWTVAPLLRDLAAAGRRISDWRPAG